MPELLILRHGESGHSFTAEDHGRTLTGHGQGQARAVGRWLRETGHLPDNTLCSDSLRTRQTCIWVNHELGEKAPTPYLDRRLYLAAARPMLSIINEVPETVRSLLVIGHMPGVQELSMELASAHSQEDPVLQMAGSWPPAGLARFTVDKPWAELDGRDANLTDFFTAG